MSCASLPSPCNDSAKFITRFIGFGWCTKLLMNWEMLAAVGQLAAAVIGIPSIIYLAVQIRAQTRERHQSAVNALTVLWGDLTRSLESAEFAPIYLRGVQ